MDNTPAKFGDQNKFFLLSVLNNPVHNLEITLLQQYLVKEYFTIQKQNMDAF